MSSKIIIAIDGTSSTGKSTLAKRISKKLNYFIKELPVKWTHKKNSKLNLINDSLKMFLKLLSIKKKHAKHANK